MDHITFAISPTTTYPYQKRQWNGDLNEIKGRVKQSIEDMAAQWSEEEKAQCVGATADAFRYGGGINAYLSGGKASPH